MANNAHCELNDIYGQRCPDEATYRLQHAACGLCGRQRSMNLCGHHASLMGALEPLFRIVCDCRVEGGDPTPIEQIIALAVLN